MSVGSLNSSFRNMDLSLRELEKDATTLEGFLDQYLDLSKNDTLVNKELLKNLFSLLDQDSKNCLKKEIDFFLTTLNLECDITAAETLLKQFAKNPFFEQQIMTLALVKAVGKQNNEEFEKAMPVTPRNDSTESFEESSDEENMGRRSTKRKLSFSD